VILVGEMRDTETVETALSAAETGHLVFATLHTIDCVETVNRIVDFPGRPTAPGAPEPCRCTERHDLPKARAHADGSGRVPAIEVMITNGRIQQCIIEPARAVTSPRSSVRVSTNGMQTFDQALVALLEQGTIDLRAATQAASNPHDLRVALQKRGLMATASRY